MIPKPRIVETDAIIPVMAALPYEVSITESDSAGSIGDYDPRNQLTRFAGKNDSTCRVDESVNPFASQLPFGPKSKSDTQKDD